MKTLSIVLASLLFVSLRLFAADGVGQKAQPDCVTHNQESRKQKDVKAEVAKPAVEEKQEVKAGSR
jgi:hypothetical protein